MKRLPLSVPDGAVKRLIVRVLSMTDLPEGGVAITAQAPPRLLLDARHSALGDESCAVTTPSTESLPAPSPTSTWPAASTCASLEESLPSAMLTSCPVAAS